MFLLTLWSGGRDTDSVAVVESKEQAEPIVIAFAKHLGLEILENRQYCGGWGWELGVTERIDENGCKCRRLVYELLLCDWSIPHGTDFDGVLNRLKKLSEQHARRQELNRQLDTGVLSAIKKIEETGTL